MNEALLPGRPVRPRRPRVGYLLAATAPSLSAVNGSVSKVMLASGFSSLRLAQVRTTGAFLGLALVVG